MFLRSIIWIFLTSFAAMMIYFLKHEVQKKEREYASFERKIKEEKQAIHLLSAELSHLSAPARVQQLADKNLQLRPVKTNMIISFDQLPEKKKPDSQVDSNNIYNSDYRIGEGVK